MINVGTGKDSSLDVQKAAIEATKRALSETGNKANLIIVFSSINFAKKELLEGIKSVAQEAKIVGCTTGGEIIDENVGEGNVAIMAIETDTIDVVVDYEEKIKGREKEAGVKLAKKIKDVSKKELKSLMILVDGFVNGQELIEGIQGVLGKYFPIVGALAGDNFQFKKTYQYFNDKVLTDSAIAVGFCGDFSFGAAMGHGWKPVSIPKGINKAEGFSIEKIEKGTGISLYKEYLGEEADQLTKEPLSTISLNYPLGFEVEGSKEVIIRTTVSATKEGSLTCAGPIIKEGKVRLMVSEIDEGIEAARNISKDALSQIKNKKPKLAIAFNCICRYKLFGPTKQKEILAIKEVIGKDVPLIGFYSHGEIGPLDSKNKDFSFSVLQNSSLCIYLLAE